MVDNIVSKPLGLVLIFIAHMVFNGTSRGEVTGILGNDTTLEFKFNISVTEYFAVYTTNHTKIAEYSKGKISSSGGDFDVNPKNTSVFFTITNLKLNHSRIYWVSLFTDSGLIIESKKVQLIVREENRSSTVTPKPNDTTKNKDSGSPSHIGVTVLVVSPVVLLAAALPLLIWCLVKSNDKQQPPSQQSSNPTVQETVEASYNVPAPPLVYSVLDFPKRSSAVLEINPGDTEYAAVNYLPEKRQV
ncbi:uncharacterized protein LOC116055497 [Sander lucioperca]|uniref:uncharacterized protein LOC116055497 n=1 Tax=Sander lucioperca TaxID=283035 RepID=UPI00125E7AA2|nr:uncharacterized protein LOC116055497 [Sander lucioperca]